MNTSAVPYLQLYFSLTEPPTTGMALSTFQSAEWDKSMVLIAIWTGKEDKANVVPVYKIMRSLCVCQFQPSAALSLERLLQRPRSPRVDNDDYDYE